MCGVDGSDDAGSGRATPALGARDRPKPDSFSIGVSMFLSRSARLVGSALLMTFVLGCSSSTSTSTVAPTPTPAPLVTDVYLAGQTETGVDASPVATVWKNGVATVLGDGVHNSGTCCVVMLGNDLYAGGLQNDGNHDRAVIWKNNVATMLTDGTQDANIIAMTVSGTDVYAAGYENGLEGTLVNNEPRLWRNGVVTQLPDHGHGGRANAVTVSGNDVYVTGEVDDNVTLPSGEQLIGNFLALWKNGVLSFPIGETPAFGEGKALVVSGSDLYIAGTASLDSTANEYAVVWKNGVVSQLGSTTDGQVYGMALSGQDVYVAGAVKSADGRHENATLWKNGMAMDYSGTASGSAIVSFAEGLQVVGDDLYVSGWLYPSAVVWKNGVATAVGVTTATPITDAFGLLVVQH